MIDDFKDLKCKVDLYDPWVDKKEANKIYGIMTNDAPINGKYDAIIIAVAHDIFKQLKVNKIRQFGKKNHVLFDVKYLLNSDEVDGRL